MQSPPVSGSHALKRQTAVAIGRGRQIRVAWAALAISVAGLLVSIPARAGEVDLELVFAVDASGSVDDSEFRLQLQGIATALNDPEVIAAIAAGQCGAIAVNLLVWGEARYPKDESGWFAIRSAADADAFARLVAGYPRTQVGGTGLGDGIAKSVTSITDNGFTAPRMVVDVSGDGPETPPRDHTVLLPQARMMANYHGITINGLAILNEAPDLDDYYRSQMIVGQGSFVEVARDYVDFARAMKRKLLREVQPEPVVGMR
jgi:hypothetical protein